MPSGGKIYRQGQDPDSLYVVISGRFRSLWKSEQADVKLVDEYGSGDLVGLVEISACEKRFTSVVGEVMSR